MNKFELVRDVLRDDLDGPVAGRPTLLDVGCRRCELKAYVAELTDYAGVDLVQNEAGTVDHVVDVSHGLPFPNRSYDFVVALDVVEHLDDFGSALEDLLRVSRRTLLIMLPNMAHIVFRLKFFRTGHLSAKYDLAYGQGQDRHRWLTVLDQSEEYMRQFATRHGLALQTLWFNDSTKKRAFGRACRALGISPQLWVWASLYVLKRA